MPSSRSVFTCQECGYQAPKWLGRCPGCDAWSSLVQRRWEATREEAAANRVRTPSLPYPEVPWSEASRTSTGLAEFDRVLGGGLVSGAVVLLGGEPGIGKSTLLLQSASALAETGRVVLYGSAEESAAQLRLRGDRLGVRSARLRVQCETDVDAILDEARSVAATVLVVDSIQAVRCAELDSVPGSVAQVREAASRLVAVAKATGTHVLLVGHSTKDGSLAGPRTLEHVVDVVVQFEGDRHHAHRILRAHKNRFGPADELGVFAMSESGLSGVANPSAFFLSERAVGAPGSAVFAALEGTRPLLVEIQALAGEGAQGSPRRTTLGVDGNRVALILAVLQMRAGIDVGSRDVFVNVTGGVSVVDPAVDLAVAAALASSLASTPLPERCAIVGEIGLTGEIRPVARIEARLREAARLGFTSALVPASAVSMPIPEGMRLLPAAHLREALDEILPARRG